MCGCSCGILISSTHMNKIWSVWSEFTFLCPPQENVIFSEPKPIWNKINYVPDLFTCPKTSDPLLSTSVLPYDTMITPSLYTVHLRDHHFHENKRSRRVDSTLNEHWDIMPYSRSINDLWKWLIISALTLIAPQAKCWGKALPVSTPERTRRDVMASFRHK